MSNQCSHCPRGCQKDTKEGLCHSEVVRCFRHRIEYGEESLIAPSHLFYLSGCNLRCRFCIGEERAINSTLGHPLTPLFFKEALDWGRRQGARNIQWVGGEPGIHVDAIMEVMKETDNLPPVVWKSNFYFLPDLFEKLWDFVDIFVADFKFGNTICSFSLCGVADYFHVVVDSLLAVYRRFPRAMIVRHLLLPGHFDCCFLPILDWFVKNIPEATFSLRDGYIPAWQAKRDPVLRKWLDPDDVRRAKSLVHEKCIHVA